MSTSSIDQSKLAIPRTGNAFDWHRGSLWKGAAKSTWSLRRSRAHDVSSSAVSFEAAGPSATDGENNNGNDNTGSTEESAANGRSFYDDFTTVDWVHDTVVEAHRKKALKDLPGLRGRIVRAYDAGQGWLLITTVALAFSVLVYAIDKSEEVLYDLHHGHCSENWLTSRQDCPSGKWITWSNLFLPPRPQDDEDGSPRPLDLPFYVLFTVVLALAAAKITLFTKTENPLAPNSAASEKTAPSTVPVADEIEIEADESTALLGNKYARDSAGRNRYVLDRKAAFTEKSDSTRKPIYTAYGSGVAEVKTILSGFIIRRYLGTRTLLFKSVALVLSISSGLCLGKEGPFVHLAACVGNVACRLFPKFSQNDMKRRQVLSAAASAGVALAFGSPLGGVLFSLEEVSYYFLPHQLFRIFFCSMISGLFLKFLNPYGTGKIVLFEVSYPNDWQFWELGNFVFIGIVGGIYGALFCKFIVWWPKFFRSRKIIKEHPMFEVFLIAVLTGLITYSNPYTSKSVAELLLDLASPCTEEGKSMELCPLFPSQISVLIASLSWALAVKIVLTAITFGTKVPAGIYVPSMVIGALFGRIVGLTIQYVDHLNPELLRSFNVATSIVSGTYAMAGAGAFMAGVTRMNVTLAVIMFELTGSLDHVLPFSFAILVANWVANAFEPNSIYEQILKTNNLPYLDNRRTIPTDATLADIITPSAPSDIIDLTLSNNVSASRLRAMLSTFQRRREFDGSIPLVKGTRLVGVVFIPELEFALDQLEQEATEAGLQYPLECRFTLGGTVSTPSERGGSESGYLRHHSRTMSARSDATIDMEIQTTRAHGIDTELSGIVVKAPLTMDLAAPLPLVNMTFTKLGSRIVCGVDKGNFVGILHRKQFTEYCRTQR